MAMATSRRLTAEPDASQREQARAAALALRAAIADPSTMGETSTCHVDLARPRRGEWWVSWTNLPGFVRVTGRGGLTYRHDLLPGWEYSRTEIRAEMIPDLEALAEHGVRPAVETR